MRFSPILLATACSSPEGVLAVSVFGDTRVESSRLESILDGAGLIVGLDIQRGEQAPITIELVDGGNEIVGRAFYYGGCQAHIRSSYDSVVLAHEIGHALGLMHIPEPTNFMAPNISMYNLDVEDWQYDWMFLRSSWLGLCT